MITIKNVGDKECPIITCDNCGKEISGYSTVVWEYGVNEVKFLCDKPDCDNKGNGKQNTSLNVFLYQLLRNCKYNKNDGKLSHEIIANI